MHFVFRKLAGVAVTAGAGAVTSYFRDPEQGAQRRQQVVGLLRMPYDLVRGERTATDSDAHGDADPTGGAAPAEADNRPA